jgi:hypothetical protein
MPYWGITQNIEIILSGIGRKASHYDGKEQPRIE